LRGLLDPLMAAEQLSLVADLVVSALVPRVEDEFALQHGRIPDAALAVLVYGKLGSLELTPSSDLDMVFIYDAPADAVSTGGAKSFPPPAYYIRLVQRIVSAFTLLTREGSLYKVDLRLRPNGDKGPLAASFESFAKYHTEDAWTWEHLALVRARLVTPAAGIGQKIGATVKSVLSRPRDPEVLLLAVAGMRALMRKEQSSKGLWDFKRNPGGLIDAEFILQYLALKHPEAWLDHPQDNRPPAMIARLVAAGVVSGPDASVLNNAIALWSRLQFMVRLTTEGDVDVADLPLGLKTKLAALAGVADERALETLMAETAQGVSALFDRIITEPAAAVRATLPPDTVVR
jgi:glutamate-ammonia-ligase adenylyltransferase